MLESGTMLLDARLRRLTTYLYVQDLLNGAHVLEVGGEGSGDFLRSRGAKSVGRAPAEAVGGLAEGEFDVAFALEAEPAGLRELAAALKRVVKPDGTIVIAVPSRDRPGARAGASYYELVDLFEPLFPSVKMVGQAPFAGSTLVEYGVADPDPVLDGTLVPKGERVEWYVIVGGPKRAGSRGYGVMQVPIAEVGALPAERRVAPAPEPKRAAPPVPVAAQPPKPQVPPPKPQAQPPAPAPAPKEPGVEELKAQVATAQKGKGELQEFVLELKRQLAERDAYVAELDGERREIGKLREEARRAEERAQKAEASERETRKRLAVAEGTVLRLRAGGSVEAGPIEGVPDLDAMRAEIEKWKQKEADSRAEAWKAHKQRADAEAQAAEVREDTVKKLKDARKLASVELTRATEEAMKKAVTLKEELARTERERKELIAEVKRLGGELDTVRSMATAVSAAAPPPAAEAESSVRVAALERELMNADAIAAADRARSAQLVADMEREAQERADVMVRLRHSLRDRDREVAALRHELSERDARLTALEQRSPPSDEVERLEADLSTSRTRLQMAMQELARKEAQVERAAAAAAHERARAERMMAAERHAVETVAQARARAADAERQLDVARERLGRLELELRGEAERVGALEQAVRRAAETARNGHGSS
jgi:chromosome segregation ATPase